MTDMKKQQAVVVGGGISGLVAAYLYARQGFEVTVVETDVAFGGLLRSCQDDDGVFYDVGTHIPSRTGIDEIDSFLFPESTRDEWLYLSEDSTGNFFGGCWDYESQLLDARNLPETIYCTGIDEYLTKSDFVSSDNTKSYLENNFGETFTNNLFKPVIEKVYGQSVPFSELARPMSNSYYFGLMRIKAFDREQAIELKKQPHHDRKLGYHFVEDVIEHRPELYSRVKSQYPKGELGTKIWIDSLVQQLRQLGVDLYTECRVDKISYSDNVITSIQLSNHRIIETSHVFWSAPPIFALKAAGIDIASVPPQHRAMAIVHLHLDRPVTNKHSHYLYVWDTEFRTFRITLYNNYTDSSVHKVSLEWPCNREELDSFSLEMGLSELVNLGIVDKNTQLLGGMIQPLPVAFPIPENRSLSQLDEQVKRLESQFENLALSGRFSGKAWTQNQVLYQAHKDIHEALNVD